MHWLLYVYAAVFGLIVGSFLNVVAHRLPRGHSTVRPRSRCPYCRDAIRARDNLPVVSYLLLRGRCRTCGAPISPRYVLLEILTAALFVACLARFGFSAEALIAATFCGLLVVLAAIDIEHFLLPDKLTLPGIMVGLVLQPWFPRTQFIDAVTGAAVGAGALILTINFWYWIRGEEGMGMGDVNMLAMIGAFLGWQGVAVTMIFGALAGSIVGLGLIVIGRMELKSRLPFGAFLAFGGLVALFWGPALIERYLRLL